MLDHLDESTRVLDLRGVLLAASAYAVAGSYEVEWWLGSNLRELLIVAVWAGAAGAFARRGGRSWIWPAAQHSSLAVWAGSAWVAAESWGAGQIERLLRPEPPGMQFTIVESGCFSPGPMDVLIVCFLLSMAAALGAIPAGWAARRLFPVQQEGGWPGSGGSRASCSRRAEGRTR